MKNSMNNLPNILTLGRIVVIPFFVLFFYLPYTWGHLAAAIIFILACITDWLDGYLARRLHQSTKLGAFLDPVADKIIVCIALVLIVGEPQFQFITFRSSVFSMPIWALTIPVAIIVCREIVVSALREWMAEIGKRTSVAVSYLGKVKTAIQMIALSVLLYCDSTTPALVIVAGYVFLYFSAVLTIWSMMIYVKAAWPELK